MIGWCSALYTVVGPKIKTNSGQRNKRSPYIPQRVSLMPRIRIKLRFPPGFRVLSRRTLDRTPRNLRKLSTRFAIELNEPRLETSASSHVIVFMVRPCSRPTMTMTLIRHFIAAVPSLHLFFVWSHLVSLFVIFRSCAWWSPVVIYTYPARRSGARPRILKLTATSYLCQWAHCLSMYMHISFTQRG